MVLEIFKALQLH